MGVRRAQAVNIYTLDPHPGRCCNLRISQHRPGTMLRCLDYENREHVCEFEQEIPPVTTGGISYPHPAPKPWVRPLVVTQSQST